MAATTSSSQEDAPSISDEPSTQKNTQESDFNNVPWPIRPSPGINYNFVVIMYITGSAIAIFFYLLEKQVLSKLLLEEEVDNHDSSMNSVDDTRNNTQSDSIESTEGSNDDTNPWHEFAKGMQGMYVIFIPFIPCMLWSLVVRHVWLKRETQVASRKKKDS